ncbi:hypothetical protein GCM10023188_10940 [Pontibacter saemangeumensis]|uniref:DUF748 domain-containing protein n=1 Tax=Pontibacter saemangeumensis TaxID=1084525 RepID=A0ABP8LDJ1_9BACT
MSLLLFVGFFFFTIWLQAKLERTVQKRSNGVYKLQLYGLQASPFTGLLSADSLSLVPDYGRWQQLQQQQVAQTLLCLKSSHIELQGLSLINVLFGRPLTLSLLEVQQPDLLVTVMREDTTQQQKPLYQTAQGILKGLQIGQIDVNSARLQYRKGPDAAENILSIDFFDLTVDDFKLDSQSFQAPDRAYYANKILVEAGKASLLFPDGTYRGSTDSIYINTESRALMAKQVKLKPTTDPAGLSRAKDRAVSYTELVVPEVRFSGLNYPAHSRHNNFIARHLLITGPELKAFKDKQNFENKGSKPLPHELAQQIQTKFLLDSVEVNSCYIHYSELVPKAAKPGNISLQQLNIKMRNVSNMPAHISEKNPAVIQASGLVMGKLPMHLEVYMPLLNENGYHRIKGEIGSGNPEILNPILGPTAFVRFESGHVSRGRFKVELNNDRATGTFHLLYRNLEIELLSKGTGGEQSVGKEILSELASWLALKDSNPAEQGERPRVGKINVSRNRENSVFSYWKDCLMDGFLSVAGLDAQAEKL